MNKMKLARLYFIVTMIFIISGCTLLLPFYGVKSPRFESINKQKEILSKYNCDTSNLYFIDTNYYDSLDYNEKYAINTYKLKKGAGASAIQLRMYNSQGAFTSGWSQCFGKADRHRIFDSVPFLNNKDLPVNQKLSLQNDLKMFQVSEEKRKQILSEARNHDYTIVLIWVGYAGVFTKRTLRNLSQYQEENPEHDFFVLKMNLTARYHYE